MVSCQLEKLSDESIFKDSSIEKTEFDKWLDRNYVEPYNIRFEYRMPDNETGFSYWVTPPDVDKAIMVAKTLKHVTLECMVEMKTRIHRYLSRLISHAYCFLLDAIISVIQEQ